MKKLLLLLTVLSFSFISCEDDDRPPLKMRATNFAQNFFFDAEETGATENADGTFTIVGIADVGVITLTISGPQEGEYPLTNSDVNFATYSFNGVEYSTRGQASGTGNVRIERWNPGARTVTGRFIFEAFNGSDGIRFDSGDFDNVSYAASANTDGDEGDGN